MKALARPLMTLDHRMLGHQSLGRSLLMLGLLILGRRLKMQMKLMMKTFVGKRSEWSGEPELESDDE